ncbi:TIGR03618 family F420-dependent PPOX class oxidoreductase [Actinoplanes sp. M2I2]|uniref:TIGR03618 family F420-dependent PPOX class oxidoreductase n=1 Tax=Actinoplanes sp. M2I2 TaxID=1734444 RepID=UPI002021D17C|nr:TIGR03618 family F420-dependent PPOX class oxidoreductase [Actinoplanes sp. M2I2]
MGITLTEAWELSRADSGLALVSTLRADQSIQTSLVNTGIVTRGEPFLAFVTYGPVKLANLRARPQVTVGFRQGWKWAAVEGRAQLAGPDDPWPGLDAEGLRLLLREIFAAAGGSHDDWDEYDRVMREQRRTAVLISPTRVYS